jgi:hypothetical protein
VYPPTPVQISSRIDSGVKPYSSNADSLLDLKIHDQNYYRRFRSTFIAREWPWILLTIGKSFNVPVITVQQFYCYEKTICRPVNPGVTPPSRCRLLAESAIKRGSDCNEDITNMGAPTVVTYNSKVKLFFSIIIFNTCNEWTLQHNMCSMSFIKVLTWIKEGVDHAWKGWIMKHLDWGPNPSAPYASTRSPRCLWYKETRRPILIWFGKVDSDSRNSPHQNRHRDHIWTPFWTFFIWMER